MFERYTESARRVLFFARYEASALGGLSIEADHILLGLTREAKGLVCEVFALSHVSLKQIRQEVEGRAQSGNKVPTSVEIPFSEDAKRTLLFAAEEADRLAHPHIATEHLLLGLLHEGTSPAAKTLAAQGLQLERVREEIIRLNQPTGATPTRFTDARELVERIKERVQLLPDALLDADRCRELIQLILRDLDTLNRRLNLP
ncbi:MAG: Clp protease N-terminal domain-containing protein [Vicinamibacterales bacterium]